MKCTNRFGSLIIILCILLQTILITVKADDPIDIDNTNLGEISADDIVLEPIVPTPDADLLLFHTVDMIYLVNYYFGGYITYNSSTSALLSTGTISTLGNKIRWITIPYGDYWLLRSAENTSCYLAVPEDTTSNNVEIISTINDRAKWIPARSEINGITLNNVYNNKYLTGAGTSLRTSASLGVAGSQSYATKVWLGAYRSYYSNTSSSEYRELTNNFQIDYNQSMDIYESQELVIDAEYDNTLWATPEYFYWSYVGGQFCYVHDGELITNGGYASNISITATHKITGFSKTITIDIEPRYINHSGNVLFGASADNYGNRCSLGSLNSTSYVENFFAYLHLVASQNSLPNNLLIRFEKTNSSTSKADFLSKTDYNISGYNVDDVDFMTFVGHGLGNKLHFSYSPNGTSHNNNPSNHQDQEFNLNYTEAQFGKGNARTKWVFAYTCRFLATAGDDIDRPEGQKVTTSEDDLYTMMDGAHILMGANSRIYLDSNFLKAFAGYLARGETIYDAYKNTIMNHTMPASAFDPETTEHMVEQYKIIYAVRARYDSLYSYASNVRSYNDGEVYRTDTFERIYCPPGCEEEHGSTFFER